MIQKHILLCTNCRRTLDELLKLEQRLYETGRNSKKVQRIRDIRRNICGSD